MAKKNAQETYKPFLVIEKERQRIVKRSPSRTGASIHMAILMEINPTIRYEIIDERVQQPQIDYAI